MNVIDVSLSNHLPSFFLSFYTSPPFPKNDGLFPRWVGKINEMDFGKCSIWCVEIVLFETKKYVCKTEISIMQHVSDGSSGNFCQGATGEIFFFFVQIHWSG